MNLQRVEEIAEAVLYEGYMLYPYRPSSVKNQQRWNFGVLCPRSWCDLQPGSESSFLHTDCLLRTTSSTRLTVEVRFLQIVQRSIGRFEILDGADDCGGELNFVDRLEVDGRVYQPWQEAVERKVTYDIPDSASLFASHSVEFGFPNGNSRETLCDAQGKSVGAIVLEWHDLSGTIQLHAESCRDHVVKLTVRVDNRSDYHPTASDPPPGRDQALLHSLVSAHVILGVENGEFLSLLDPPEEYEDLAAQCENKGVWPVLAGDDATTLLASPIILYDHPRIAPESAGNLFDATEIDEILSLRILTLTDQEKAEVRQSDDRARDLLERTENIPNEQFMKLHGILRGLTVLKEGPA